MGLIIERLRVLGTSTIYRMSKQLQKIIGWSLPWLLLAPGQGKGKKKKKLEREGNSRNLIARLK